MNVTQKQVIVMRTDLGMRKGKMIAQGGHASMMFLRNRMKYPVRYSQPKGDLWEYNFRLNSIQEAWLSSDFTKICVRVDSEEELLSIHEKAKTLGVESNLVLDAGLTEFGGNPTYTCLAVGPDITCKVDKVTGHLRLL